MDTDILDDHEKEQEIVLSIAIKWWEKKRLLFNLLVGGIGILGLLFSRFAIHPEEIIGLAIYGGLMNVMYSIGFLLEAMNKHYLKGKIEMVPWRLPLFILGTLVSMFVTLIASLVVW
ncbi:MAG: hypothetical protein ACI857_000346 [Arenicella sp.]|jgi:hypothetical protein